MDLDGGYKCRVLEFHETSLCNRTQEDILNDVDGISSAECTPEAGCWLLCMFSSWPVCGQVGQRFRSSSSMKVLPIWIRQGGVGRLPFNLVYLVFSAFSESASV